MIGVFEESVPRDGWQPAGHRFSDGSVISHDTPLMVLDQPAQPRWDTLVAPTEDWLFAFWSDSGCPYEVNLGGLFRSDTSEGSYIFMRQDAKTGQWICLPFAETGEMIQGLASVGASLDEVHERMAKTLRGEYLRLSQLRQLREMDGLEEEKPLDESYHPEYREGSQMMLYRWLAEQGVVIPLGSHDAVEAMFENGGRGQ